MGSAITRLPENMVKNRHFRVNPLTDLKALPCHMMQLTCYVSSSLETFPLLHPYSILVSSFLRDFQSSVLTREGPVARKLLMTPSPRNVHREEQAVWPVWTTFFLAGKMTHPILCLIPSQVSLVKM